MQPMTPVQVTIRPNITISGDCVSVRSDIQHLATHGSHWFRRKRQTQKTPVMLLHEYDGADPSGWLVSEKYDGVRAMWNGRRLVSRAGNEISAPRWFTGLMPSVAVDGELWAGRGNLGAALSACGSADSDAWSIIKFVAFDLPLCETAAVDRIAKLQDAVQNNRVVLIAHHAVCDGVTHLYQMLNDIVGGGGEGVVLRNPSANYEFCRSYAALKLKPLNQD